MTSNPIIIPLLNPNEPEAVIAGLHVSEGQPVTSGDVICTLETTKSAADLTAEFTGYVVGLRFQQGDSVNAGEVLCYLADAPDWQPSTSEPAETPPIESSDKTADAPPPGLRITHPALALARQTGLDLTTLPQDRLVTESIVRILLDSRSERSEGEPFIHSIFDATAIIIYGGGGHGKAVIDLLRALGVYHIVGVLDDGIPSGEMILDIPVLGGVEMLSVLVKQGVRLAVNAVGGIGNVATRVKVFEKLAGAGFVCPALVHPRAFIEPSASLSPGVQVFPQAYVGSQAQIGFGCIINTGAIISHDCILGDFTNISPGAILAGEVKVGERVLVGMGVTINLRVKIGAAARLGNSSTIITDVPAHGVVRADATWAK